MSREYQEECPKCEQPNARTGVIYDEFLDNEELVYLRVEMTQCLEKDCGVIAKTVKNEITSFLKTTGTSEDAWKKATKEVTGED